MKPRCQLKLISAVVVGMCSSYASASGFALLEQNLSGLGNSYAGSAAVAENASTIFFNPAGMTQLKDREFSGGLAVIAPSFKFTNKGSSVGVLAASGDGGDAGRTGYVPNAYMSWALSKDLYVGAGFSAPFGLKTEYNNPWVGAAQATSFSIETYNFNPSVAYRVNSAVSVGGGLNWQRIDAQYKRAASVASAVGAASTVTATLTGSAWGWNAGGLFTVSPATKFGVSYRSNITQETTGDIVVTGPSAALNALQTSGAKASLKLPDSWIFSATHQVSDKWQLLGDVSFTGWSSIPKLDLVRTTTGATAQTIKSDFRDTWRIAAGATYKYNPTTNLKFGVAFDQTPVQSASERLVSLPDNDRTQISVGSQYLLGNGSTLDLGLAYLMIGESSINNNQTALGRGTVTGSFSGNAVIVGVQYSMPF
jgi:long-chain fatty acid transport protein